MIVQPETVLRWNGNGHGAYWRWKSKGALGRPRIPRHPIAFIRRISSDHPKWGEDKMALELKLKLGVEHSTSTIRRYMADSGTPDRTSTWKQFIESHAEQTFAVDFTTQILWKFRRCRVFVVMALKTREIIHVDVTTAPTLPWVKQQLPEVTAWDNSTRFWLHGNDQMFGQFGKRRAAVDGTSGRTYRCALNSWLHGALGIEGISIPYGPPNANARLERFMGTLLPYARALRTDSHTCLEEGASAGSAHPFRGIKRRMNPSKHTTYNSPSGPSPKLATLHESATRSPLRTCRPSTASRPQMWPVAKSAYR